MARFVVRMGIAALAVVGALTVLGAGTASATKLCTVEGLTKTCPAGQEVKATAALKFSLKMPAQFSIKIALVECQTSSFEGEVTNAGGGAGVPVKATLKNLAFGKCNNNCSVTPMGSPWSATFEGSGNRDGDMTWSPSLEFNCNGTKCFYSDLVKFAVKGGFPATLEPGPELTMTGGDKGCANPGSWSGDYSITTPMDLWVTEK